MTEPKKLTPRGKVLIALTIIVIFIFGLTAFLGRESIGTLFQGKLRYFWVVILLAVGYFSAHETK
ncbi:MAG: hypothetical protein WCQ97_08175 [Aminobacterium sp.]|jgi:hypothetical protein|uniref:Uncharacterized protein n=1 Tax=bioreactor metagenome TaxID=1076179 RepID=A0A645HQD4_9ZZZZ|nr:MULTISPECIES: hypothetical protein [unclassified Aminobacterium]MDD2205758.1 hypothetical protein [Aminobacterium sp.]MDD3426326.1 hypothetical protein [Aminobacterium sp.]MDD3708296.1 hypothetical protein [Aminobacterium sp.]MDD4229219.1 hypothetical protein [Aminobacterium sp.]MDD4552004.1 hypothetical protein [Aminobacterium sp.]